MGRDSLLRMSRLGQITKLEKCRCTTRSPIPFSDNSENCSLTISNTFKIPLFQFISTVVRDLTLWPSKNVKFPVPQVNHAIKLSRKHHLKLNGCCSLNLMPFLTPSLLPFESQSNGCGEKHFKSIER